MNSKAIRRIWFPQIPKAFTVMGGGERRRECPHKRFKKIKKVKKHHVGFSKGLWELVCLRNMNSTRSIMPEIPLTQTLQISEFPLQI